ncbi:MAG: hypothetical protein NC819_04215 [Candidatus Omnitrophica bacterium]|nr:hypothetical protein [Candidatus Omnitrophota bacterium]
MKLKLLSRITALFLSAALFAPAPAQAFRPLNPAENGQTRTALSGSLLGDSSGTRNSAGLEENENARQVRELLKGVGIPHIDFSPANVLNDPAMGLQAIRHLSRMSAEKPGLFSSVEEGQPLQIGWGLELCVKPGNRYVLTAPEAGASQPYDVYASFSEQLHHRAWEVGAAELLVDEGGVSFQNEEIRNWRLLERIFLPEALWEFLQDRRLMLHLVLPLDDNAAWEQLPWLLDPRTLARNIPYERAKGTRGSPVAVFGPALRPLPALCGYVDAMRPDTSRGRAAHTVPASFVVRAASMTRQRKNPVLDATKIGFLVEIEQKGVLRPGQFSWRKGQILKRLNDWFGADGWRIVYRFADQTLEPAEAIALYEQAYVDYFTAHPAELDELVTRARDVYDTAPSNVASGLDYGVQETEAAHIHDIAIRRAVQRLGRTFQGSELLEVRGPTSPGHKWSPGVVPFHRPDLILQPAVPGWWQPGSIEDFYQSNKMIVLRRGPADLLVTTARNLARVLYKPTLTFPEMASAPWILPPVVFPRGPRDVPRKVTDAELSSLLNEINKFFTTSSRLFPEGFRRREAFQEMQALYLALTTHRHTVPDIEYLRSHTDNLASMFRVIEAKKAMPIFLGRDALTMFEFGSYVAAMRGESFQAGVMYHPGAPKTSSVSLSFRTREEDLEYVIDKTSELWERCRDILEEEGLMVPGQKNPGTFARLEVLFAEGVEKLIREDHRFAAYSEKLYQQFRRLNIPSGTPLLIVDGNATGRSVLYVRQVIRHYAAQRGREFPIEVFLGWARDKSFGIPELAEVLPVKGEAFHDLHWPFRYAGSDANGLPTFSVVTNIAKLLFSAYQSVELYNSAVDYVTAPLLPAPPVKPISAGLEEAAGVDPEARKAELSRLDAELRADLEKPLSQRTVRQMYVREMAYRKQRPGEDHSHHVGVMVSYSPTEPSIGFLPLRNFIIDREKEIRVGVKIHLLQDLLDHNEPIPLIVQRMGMSYKPGRHLDFVFISARPLFAREVRDRQRMLDERASGSGQRQAGLEEDIPSWLPLEKLLVRFGAGPGPELENLRQVAAEADADQVLLIPVSSRRKQGITLHPYLAAGVSSLDGVHEYLGRANRLMIAMGIRFEQPKDLHPRLERLGFVIYEVVEPSGLPERYTTVAADQLSAGSPGYVHPALLAAKTLHPLLPWEFLKQYAVKGVLVLEDELTSARYLAILA